MQKRILKNGLTILFDKSVDNLPNSLINLTLGYYFNQSIIKLPNSVKYLSFWSHYTFKNNIPKFIETLELFFNNDGTFIDNIPLNIKKIIIHNELNKKYLQKIPFGCIVEIIK